MSHHQLRALVLIAIVGLVLSACTRHPSPHDEARAAEIEALQLEAERIDPVGSLDFASDAGWEQIGPGVWRRLKFDDDGALVGERVKATGHDAFAWLRSTYFPARLATLTESLGEASTDFERMIIDDQIMSAERFLAAAERWAEGPGESSPVTPLQSCDPMANATAAPTTASPGAKAYANGRNCSYFNSGWVDTYAFAGGNHDADTQSLVGFGATGYATAVSYGSAGTDCYSRAEAVGYPSAFDSDTYSAKCS